MRHRLHILFAFAALAVSIALIAGCGKLKGAPKADQPPHTVLFIQGPVDPVNHVVHMYWLGTDADGYVTGYQLKLVNPADPDTTHAQWRNTARTDSVFTIYSPQGSASPTLYVRAIDNQGVADPHPASELFRFNNTPPVVALTVKPRRVVGELSDTTFAAVTVTWTLTDPDGDPTKAQYRLWLDPAPGAPIDYMFTGNTTFTVPSAKFGTIGAYSVKRTLHVQAIDDGGMLSQIDSVTWNVRRPVAGARARVLFIDDLPTSDAGRIRTDSIYVNAMLRVGVHADEIGTLTYSTCQPFKSGADLFQTMSLFEAVVWVRGSNTGNTASAALTSYSDGVGAYLDAGGKLYVESTNLVATTLSVGALTRDFMSKYANVSDLIEHDGDVSAWTIKQGSKLFLPTLNDSLTVVGAQPTGLNAFVTRDPSQVFMLANPGGLSEVNPIPAPVGLSVPQANGGRWVISTFPLIAASAPSSTQRASATATAIMRLLGLGQ